MFSACTSRRAVLVMKRFRHFFLVGTFLYSSERRYCIATEYSLGNTKPSRISKKVSNFTIYLSVCLTKNRIHKKSRGGMSRAKKCACL